MALIVLSASPWTLLATPSPDCNTNLIPDATDIANGTNQDCNNNGIPDECDIAAGTSQDGDGDGVPDECDNCPTTANADQADDDGNGIGDVCQDCCGGTTDGMMMMPMTLLGIGWMRRRRPRVRRSSRL